MHTEPERAEGVKLASNAFSEIFASETGQRDKATASATDPASLSDVDSMKKQLLTLLGGMDSQDHLKVAGLKSFLNDEMADASRSEGRSISSANPLGSPLLRSESSDRSFGFQHELFEITFFLSNFFNTAYSACLARRNKTIERDYHDVATVIFV